MAQRDGHTKQRTSRACDTCHRRGRRCQVDSPTDARGNQRCRFCQDHGLSCTWQRVPGKRGPKVRSAAPAAIKNEETWTLDAQKHGSQEVVEALLKSFFDFVYPICNYVHEDTFMALWRTRQIPGTRSSYALLMALCSLASYRIKQGIAPAEPVELQLVRRLRPDVYLREAQSAIGLSLDTPKKLEDLQAIALMCSTSQEMGNAAMLQQYLGLYHAAVANQSLHDEARWPADISPVEREQRRRLYWWIYRLEVHLAMVLGHAVRCPELQSLVAYPEVPDATGGEDDTEWLTGWNFVTDLYRGLEHLLTKYRLWRRSADGGLGAARLSATNTMSTMFLLDYDPEARIHRPLQTAVANLPRRFRKAEPHSANIAMNRCGFQATNIVCTYQLVRIMAYAFSKSTFRQACRTAIDLVDEMAAIPIDYLRWTTLAATQELSGIGHILWQFMRQNLSVADRREIRSAILCIKEYLESLQSSFEYVVRAIQRLGKYVEEVDQAIERSNEGQSASQGYTPRPHHDNSIGVYNHIMPNWDNMLPEVLMQEAFFGLVNDSRYQLQ